MSVKIKVSNTHGIITDSREWSVQTAPDTGQFNATVPGPPFVLQEGTWKIEVWIVAEPSVADAHEGDVASPDA